MSKERSLEEILKEWASASPFAYDDLVDATSIIDKCREDVDGSLRTLSALMRKKCIVICWTSAFWFVASLAMWTLGLLTLFGYTHGLYELPWYNLLLLAAPAITWLAVKDFYWAWGRL